MARNKLSKQLERLAQESGLLSEQVARPPQSPPSSPSVRFTKPPTVNNLFLSAGRKRVKTPEYRQWIDVNKGEAGRLAKPDKFPVVMCYRLCGKFNRSADGANYEKPAIDLLVSEGVLPEDNLRHITGGRWEFAPSEDEPHVVVWWEEVK